MTGPCPCDTIFLRAKAGDLDGILTMSHDQGQIAMKLMGFDGGVTIAGGLPVPFRTPAHGTAFDVVGKGVANTGSVQNAFDLAVGIGGRRAARRRIHAMGARRRSAEGPRPSGPRAP